MLPSQVANGIKHETRPIVRWTNGIAKTCRSGVVTMTNHENGSPTPTNFAMGSIKALLLAAVALVIAALAIVLFSALQTGIACEFRPVTYAIFTGIVLAAVGSAIGGQAAVSGKFPIGIGVTITGGAAFLIAVMGAVWWATRTPCAEFAPAIKLSAIPIEYATARLDPIQQDAQIRIRFDRRLRVRQYVDSQDLGFMFNFTPSMGEFDVQIDLIRDNKSVQACEISIKQAPDQFIKNRLLEDKDKFIPLERNSENMFELSFRPEFLREILKTYQFDTKYHSLINTCIQAGYYDSATREMKYVPVSEIFFVEPGMIERLGKTQPLAGNMSALLSDFSLYAIRNIQTENAVSEKPTEPPVPKQVVATQPPAQPNVSCVGAAGDSKTKTAFETLMQTGVVADEDLKLLFENWCEVEGRFYSTLTTAPDSALRYRLIRFVRSSITAIDQCWASNDDFRQKNANVIKCEPKLNRPRDLSRPLPFARKLEQKSAILDRLRDDNLQIRKEVEVILRLYPHNDFATLFDKILGTGSPADTAPNISSAAVSYYYDRIVESGWAETVQAASNAEVELQHGLGWADKLPDPDRAIARARIQYALGSMYVQVTEGKARPVALTTKITTAFSELLKLSQAAMIAYPYPHHFARALVYVSGKPADIVRFESINIDKFQSMRGSKPVTLDTTSYETTLWTFPDVASLKIRPIVAGETGRLLMQYNTDATAASGFGWQLVATNSSVGWIKRKAVVH